MAAFEYKGKVVENIDHLEKGPGMKLEYLNGTEKSKNKRITDMLAKLPFNKFNNLDTKTQSLLQYRIEDDINKIGSRDFFV